MSVPDRPELQVHGSANFLQTLLKNDLVDEFWLKFFPVTVGKGKNLFGEGAMPAGFKLTNTQGSPNGVIVANYVRDGSIQTGSFGALSYLLDNLLAPCHCEEATSLRSV